MTRWLAAKLPERIFFILEHVYSEAQITGFKNRDRAMVDVVLRAIAHSGLPICVFVGKIRRDESGISMFGDRDIADTQTEFTALTKLQPAGTLLKLECDVDEGDCFEFDEEEVVQENYFENHGPDGESEGSDTGNEGAEFRQWYNATALLFVPATNAPPPPPPLHLTPVTASSPVPKQKKK